MNRRGFLKTSGLVAVATATMGALASLFVNKNNVVKHTTLEKVGARRVIVEIKKDIEHIARDYLFLPNTETTRNQFNCRLQAVLDEKYVNTKAINAYYLFNDETTNPPDTNGMIGSLVIQRLNSVENDVLFFQITFA